MTEITGISYPLRPEHADRLLTMSEAVFMKYTTHGTIPPKLKKGMYFFIYQSHSNKEMVGKARIVDFKLMGVKDILEKHEDKLFITKDELMAYSRGREKKALVLVLDNIVKYEKPIKLDKCVNMGGKYIHENDPGVNHG